MCCKKSPQGIQQVGQTSGVLCQLGSTQRCAVVQQVHMAVVEACADELTCKISQGIALCCQCLCVGIAARKDELAVFHGKGRNDALASVDLTLVIDRFH